MLESGSDKQHGSYYESPSSEQNSPEIENIPECEQNFQQNQTYSRQLSHKSDENKQKQTENSKKQSEVNRRKKPDKQQQQQNQRSTFNSKFDYCTFNSDHDKETSRDNPNSEISRPRTFFQIGNYGNYGHYQTHRPRVNTGPANIHNRSHKDISSLVGETQFVHYDPAVLNRHSLVLYPNYYHFNYGSVNNRLVMNRSGSYSYSSYNPISISSHNVNPDIRRPPSLGAIIAAAQNYPTGNQVNNSQNNLEAVTSSQTGHVIKPVRMMNTISWISIPTNGGSSNFSHNNSHQLQQHSLMHPSHSFSIPSKITCFILNSDKQPIIIIIFLQWLIMSFKY